MRNKFVLLSICILILSAYSAFSQGSYHLVIEGFDWGPAVNKVILKMDETIEQVSPGDFVVRATRSSDLSENPISPSHGELNVHSAYVSDEKGNHAASGQYVTLLLEVGPQIRIGSPFQYVRFASGGGGNIWVDYKLTVLNTESLRIWNNESGRSIPLIDDFDLSGRFTAEDGISMSYASFTPDGDKDEYPLIIWLHGGGEGGTDPTIPLLANRAANYASDEIQQYFGGAYVLVPQTPTRWMDSGSGSTRGQVDDIYYKALKELFDEYITAHPDIDRDRIYVGGCSNGGYMSLKMILEYPKYFAAGYISALAYFSEYLTDDQVKSIRNVPMWFVHSRDDSTTVAANTVVPVYERLQSAGAKNVHFTFYDHVVDITGLLGGDDFHYPGHWSWIYSHANKSQTDYDGSPVMVDGVPVTIMQWLSMQSK